MHGIVVDRRRETWHQPPVHRVSGRPRPGSVGTRCLDQPQLCKNLERGRCSWDLNMILICYGSSEEGAGGINSLKNSWSTWVLQKPRARVELVEFVWITWKKQLTPVLLKCYSEFNCYSAWAFIKHTLDSCKNSQAVVRNTPLRTVMLEFCGTKLWNCENTFWCQTLHYAPKKQPQNVQLRKVIPSNTICFAICSFRPYWIHL